VEVDSERTLSVELDTWHKKNLQKTVQFKKIQIIQKQIRRKICYQRRSHKPKSIEQNAKSTRYLIQVRKFWIAIECTLG
jgi:hypothetical protein